MEGYSQQGFRPGRLAIIIKSETFVEDIGKVVELVMSCQPNCDVRYEGQTYHCMAGHGVAWVVKATGEQKLSLFFASGKTEKSRIGFRPQCTLMLIDDPDKELDTMEERLNNAHPLLLTHKQEEKV